MNYSPTSAWHDTGFKIGRKPGIDRAVIGNTELLPLQFENLNPHVQFTNCMSRWELFRLGLWFLRQSVSRWR